MGKNNSISVKKVNIFAKKVVVGNDVIRLRLPERILLHLLESGGTNLESPKDVPFPLTQAGMVSTFKLNDDLPAGHPAGHTRTQGHTSTGSRPAWGDGQTVAQ